MRSVSRTIWTPSLVVPNMADLSVSYGTPNYGTWALSGSIAVAGFDSVFTPTFTSATGNMSFGQLPPPASPFNNPLAPLTSDNFYIGGGVMVVSAGGITFPTGATYLAPVINSTGSLFIQAGGTGVASSLLNIQNSLVSGTTYRIRFTIAYIVGP